jgi:hypothetical protein
MMAGFLQLVAFTTSRIDEVNALADQMRESKGDATGLVRRGTFTADRDRPDHYVSIIEFDSYDLAVANAEHPETALFGSKMAALCEGPPTFYNLDVMSTWPT